MRFNIDTIQAKTMATRLQDFLVKTPKNLSRSSAIEAVAQMLGFNNRNEMLARLKAEATDEIAPSIAQYEMVIEEVKTWRNNIPMTGDECYNAIRMRLDDLGHAAEKVPTHTPYPDPSSPREVALDALNDLRIQETETTAVKLVAEGRRNAPDEDFWDAMHAECADFDGHVMMQVEIQIVQQLLADPQRRALLSGIFSESPEMEGARHEGLDNPAEMLARTLVNEALPQAENLWDTDQE